MRLRDLWRAGISEEKVVGMSQQEGTPGDNLQSLLETIGSAGHVPAGADPLGLGSVDLSHFGSADLLFMRLLAADASVEEFDRALLHAEQAVPLGSREDLREIFTLALRVRNVLDE